MKTIPNYKRYKATKSGRIYSCLSRRFLKPSIQKGGYLKVRVVNDEGEPKTELVHRLILKTYLGNEKGKEVNHKNGIKNDNRLENLEWCTRSENLIHAYRLLNIKPWNKGLINKQGKPISQKKDGELVAVWYSASDAERSGYRQSSINKCLKGVYKTHAGYQWNYT